MSDKVQGSKGTIGYSDGLWCGCGEQMSLGGLYNLDHIICLVPSKQKQNKQNIV